MCIALTSASLACLASLAYHLYVSNSGVLLASIESRLSKPSSHPPTLASHTRSPLYFRLGYHWPSGLVRYLQCQDDRRQISCCFLSKFCSAGPTPIELSTVGFSEATYRHCATQTVCVPHKSWYLPGVGGAQAYRVSIEGELTAMAAGVVVTRVVRRNPDKPIAEPRCGGPSVLSSDLSLAEEAAPSLVTSVPFFV